MKMRQNRRSRRGKFWRGIHGYIYVCEWLSCAFVSCAGQILKNKGFRQKDMLKVS